MGDGNEPGSGAPGALRLELADNMDWKTVRPHLVKKHFREIQLAPLNDQTQNRFAKQKNIKNSRKKALESSERNTTRSTNPTHPGSHCILFSTAVAVAFGQYSKTSA